MLWPTKPRTTVCGVEQVLQLQYRVRWLSDDVSVRNDAAPVKVQLAGFSCSLSGETLIAEPSSDYSSVDAAQQPAVAIDDVVALSHAVQVSRVLGEFPKPARRCPRREAWLTSCDSGGEHNGKAVSGFPVPAMPF
jgi:hypothetical protein